LIPGSKIKAYRSSNLAIREGEIDYWDRLSANPNAGQCGWLKLKMKKFDIDTLKRNYEGA